MTDFLPFHQPEIGPEEIESVVAALRSGWVTTGPKVKEFEEIFSSVIGAPHCVAVNSCTAALHLALEAVGLREGDEVVVPTMTFAATAEVVTYFKAKPVLVDCRPDTLTLGVEHVERALTRRTKAIIPVHFAGHPCDMDDVLMMAGCRKVRVIEDAAHALPARYHDRMVGTIGDITCFSFYATKGITTGEGGVAATQNPEWADRMRTMSLHGMTRDAWGRYRAGGTWRYDIEAPGYKYNMTDIAAALGIPQLHKCERFWRTRQRYAGLYRQGLADLPEISLPHVDDGVDHSWHLYVIQLNLERLRINRDEFVDLLTKNQIGASVHFIPLHHHSYYRRTLGCRTGDFPVANRAFERIVSLPLYPRMAESDVGRVIDVVRSIILEYRR